MILLEASTLRLVRTLAFKEAFPSSGGEIAAVAVEPQAKLVRSHHTPHSVIDSVEYANIDRRGRRKASVRMDPRRDG